MAAKVRRVVTGHDPDGRAVVKIDQTEEFVQRRQHVAARVLWTTDSIHVDNSIGGDGARQDIGLTIPGGTVFRMIQFEPGNPSFVHRTSSLDYAVIIDGEIEMELDAGESVHLEAGDVVVQRGTTHGWFNRGTEPCRVVFVLISASPVEIDGRVLDESIPG
jgi:quercetin dioxygenase-like cupin family protein